MLPPSIAIQKKVKEKKERKRRKKALHRHEAVLSCSIYFALEKEKRGEGEENLGR